jgi:hypothetical protein
MGIDLAHLRFQPQYLDEMTDRVGCDLDMLVLASASDRELLTITRWSAWDSLQAVTGASQARPIRTQHIDGLASFDADHFELLPTDPPGATPGEPRQTAWPVDRSCR